MKDHASSQQYDSVTCLLEECRVSNTDTNPLLN
jgi:hypothetical protein